MALDILRSQSTQSNPDYAVVRRADLDLVLAAHAELRAAAAAVRDNDRLHDATGVLRAHLSALVRSTSAEPIALYEPPPEDEPYHPSPEDSAWASEHVTPCRLESPGDLLQFLSDMLASIGLDPTVHRESLDVTAMGRDYSLELRDLTAYFERAEAEARSRDPQAWEAMELCEARLSV